MDLDQIIIFLIIGGVAGWLAGLIFRGDGFGILRNIVIGVLGAVLGGRLFGILGISFGGETIAPVITATVGAIVLLFLIGLVKKA